MLAHSHRASSPDPRRARQSYVQDDRLVQEGYVPQMITYPILSDTLNDAIWFKLYVFSMCCLFATSFLIWLRTEVTTITPITDSIYTVVSSSSKILFVDTVVAISISAAWFVLVRLFVRPLLYILLFSIPMGLVSLTIYPMTMSYKDSYGGNTPQDRAMRWTSLVPFLFAAGWVWFAYKGRHALDRGIGIIHLACNILNANRALIGLSIGTLSSFMVFTWIWIGMFTRVFLKGRAMADSRGLVTWILDANCFLLGAWYTVMYLWTWGVFSGVQRVCTSATVSQWYFHRPAARTLGSTNILSAALYHSASTYSGTICFSSFAALLIRIPLMVLPKRLTAVLQLFCFQFIAGPIGAVTNPLTLSYAAVTATPLVPASRGVANLRVRDIGQQAASPYAWTAYRLSKMLLTSARALTALGLGFGAWVHAAHDNGGSLYGYIVGLLGAGIGWVVLGATEGNLSMIVDATFICFAIDQSANKGGHCKEADALFGIS
ncbi:uncharacterized protein V1510DRAFT_361947 [Dipodascopsis tothii]|uniref:uncharacterized protein n=1 Tax=Dipodascopsis tothii TaxID=44089 RepID=UPI0034CF04A6